MAQDVARVAIDEDRPGRLVASAQAPDELGVGEAQRASSPPQHVREPVLEDLRERHATRLDRRTPAPRRAQCLGETRNDLDLVALAGEHALHAAGALQLQEGERRLVRELAEQIDLRERRSRGAAAGRAR